MKLVCIVCPNGCTLTAEKLEGGIAVSGHRCPRGEEFARAELTRPMRTVCTTVRTVFKEAPVLPVRVSADIPKDRIFDVMHEINSIILDRRIARGEPVIKNVLGLGADVIATSSLLLQRDG